MSKVTKQGNSLYHIYISGDSLPYASHGHYRCWFYFSVTGVKRGENLTFSIRNMGNQTKLYKNGLKPVLRVDPSRDDFRLFNGTVNWESGDSSFTLSFTQKFNWESNETAYFAWTFPYSFERSLERSFQL